MKKGFTLIEILLALSILAIVSAVVVPSVSRFSDSNTVNQVSQNIVNDIELVKFKAISGAYFENSSASWGIEFCTNGENDKYKLVGISNDGTNQILDSQVITLPPLTTLNCTAPISVIFERFSSIPLSGTDTSIVVVKNGNSRIITISGSSGKISLTAQ